MLIDTGSITGLVLSGAAALADTPAGDGSHGGGGAWWIALIPFLPFLGAAVIGALAAGGVRSKAPAWLTVALLAASFGLTLLAYLGWDGHSVLQFKLFDWIDLSWERLGAAAGEAAGARPGQSVSGDFAFYLDGLSLLWMLFVTGLACLIGLYASEYMEHDVGAGYSRFFVAFCLFVFSMSCLVMADNLLLLFLGWEGVGLCSYLLIGYFYKKRAAVDAGRKAFVVNRIGDLGLLMAIFLTFTTFGTIEFGPLFAQLDTGTTATGVRLDAAWQTWAIGLLLLAGAFGKSAQLFFYVWLPDAMEGPTPVSALIHAATMVTAGVYLVARMMPIFHADPNAVALNVVAWGGTITALWAATIAMAQFDIKRIMGYSTASQLGYMFAGLGALGAAGGVYHVFTHAFFKATLFLACGAVMHGFAGQLDMRRLSGLRSLPGWGIVTLAMLVGCLNLAGFPLTAGYFSKDMILASAFEAPGSVLWGGQAIGWILLFTAGLTAYYTFRVFFRVFVGEVHYEPGDEHHGDDHAEDHGNEHDHSHAHAGHGSPGDHGHGFHPHAPGWAMNTVLALLAAGSLLAFAPYFLGEHHGWAGDMVHASTAVTASIEEFAEDPGHAEGVAAVLTAGEEPVEPATIFGFSPHKAMYYISGVVGLLSIGVAWFFHAPTTLGGARTRPDEVRMDAVSAAIRPVSRLAERKWLVDEFYQFLIVRPLRLISKVFEAIDKLLIDGIVDGLGGLPRVFASVVRPVSQTGVLHDYALRMVGGVAVVLVIVVLALSA